MFELLVFKFFNKLKIDLFSHNSLLVTYLPINSYSNKKLYSQNHAILDSVRKDVG